MTDQLGVYCKCRGLNQCEQKSFVLQTPNVKQRTKNKLANIWISLHPLSLSLHVYVFLIGIWIANIEYILNELCFFSPLSPHFIADRPGRLEICLNSSIIAIKVFDWFRLKWTGVCVFVCACLRAKAHAHTDMNIKKYF